MHGIEKLKSPFKGKTSYCLSVTSIRNGMLWMYLIGFSLFTSAQTRESFGEILVKANKEYESGNFTTALELATSCSIEQAEMSDQWKAHRLVTMIYLANGQPDLARESAEKMLELNPTYKINYLKDPAELIQLLKSIRIIPKFSLGLAVSLGTNTTFPDITKGYVLSDYTKSYTSENAFQFGLSFGYTLSEHVSIDMGCLATRKAYSIDYSLSNWDVNIEEKLTYIDLPLLVKYLIYPRKSWHITAQAGVFGGYLLFGENNFSATFTPTGKHYNLSNINSGQRRNPFNYGLIGGIGGTYKIAEGDLALQFNYFRSFANITKSSTRYTYNELIYNYFYEDDDIILNNLAITVGYAFYLNYKILKKR